MIRRPPRSTLFPLHDALPISGSAPTCCAPTTCSTTSSKRAASTSTTTSTTSSSTTSTSPPAARCAPSRPRSEEHTSELQSRQYLVCRLLLEKKKILHYQIKKL